MYWLKDFSQDPLETYLIAKKIVELEKITYTSMTLVMPTLLETKKFLSQYKQLM